MECSDFPPLCVDQDDKVAYITDIKRNCGIKLEMANVRKDPTGRTLNKGMANSVWEKWAQNPGGQSGFRTCSTLKEYHDALRMGHVKRVSLVLDSLLQVELDNDRNVDGENRESFNARNGLGGRNTIAGPFVMAVVRDLMFSCFLSKLAPGQLLYTDTDSVIYLHDSHDSSHVELPTSDMLGDLKDEYAELSVKKPEWCIKNLLPFHQKCTRLCWVVNQMELSFVGTRQ